MTRKLKMLGMALVAVFALTAVAASAASAADYTASTYPTTATGASETGNTTFVTEAGKSECKAHFEGTLTAASPTFTVKATYTNCRAFGFITSTVSMGSCDYLFGTPALVSEHVYTSTFQIKCGATPISIVSSTCETTIGEQSPAGHVIYKDETAAGDVNVQVTVTGIKYTVTKDGLGCPFSGTGAKTGASETWDNPVTFDAVSPSTASIDVG